MQLSVVIVEIMTTFFDVLLRPPQIRIHTCIVMNDVANVCRDAI